MHHSIHLKKWKNLYKRKTTKCCLIPAYWPEMAPVEKYFSMLKRVVTKQSSGLQINWKSKESRVLLQKSMQMISSKNIQNFWLTFTFEMKQSLDKIEEFINKIQQRFEFFKTGSISIYIIITFLNLKFVWLILVFDNFLIIFSVYLSFNRM